MATQELSEAAKVIDWHSQLRPAIDNIRKSGKLLKRDGKKVNEKFEKVRKKRKSKHFNDWITKYNQELRTFSGSMDIFRKELRYYTCKMSLSIRREANSVVYMLNQQFFDRHGYGQKNGIHHMYNCC